MKNDLPQPPFFTEFYSIWSGVVSQSAPVFVRLLPVYLAITLCTSIFAVAVLLVLGKAAFHLACMLSPLILVLIGLAADKLAGARGHAAAPASWLPVYAHFWRYSAPLALAIAVCLNVIFLIAMVLSDLGSWRGGALPNLNFPADLFTPQKLPLLLMLLTTATEQQLIFLPFLVVLGGRLEPHLVGGVVSGLYSRDQAFEMQRVLTKRQKGLLAPMRLLVMLGVSLQFMAKDISGDHPVVGKLLLLSSYFGWLMYACMLATITKMIPCGSRSQV